jgi:hypothetical protein
VQYFQLANDRALIGKESDAFFNRQFEHFGNVASPPGDFEGLFAIATTFACRAGHFDVGHKGELRDIVPSPAHSSQRPP